MTISYLVSTAGHAQHQNELYPHNVRSILQLIDEGAQEFGDEKVVGFTSVNEKGRDGEWICERYSFRQLIELSDIAAHRLVEQGVQLSRDVGGIVCMLLPTGLDFLITWIALMRMGYGVVLVAPQCSPAAIVNLHQTTSSSHIIFHPTYSKLVEQALLLDPSIKSIEMSSHHAQTTSNNTPGSALAYPVTSPESVSHVFHSSGTSGLPKPIPNTHVKSVSVLPRRCIPSYLSTAADGPSTSQRSLPPAESAAFTTTPLFHGGVSDLLRAWMARSMLYFYPTSEVPITATNVVRAVEACQAPPDIIEAMKLQSSSNAEREKRFKVSAFLSVPYILSILAENLDGDGMKMLREMDFVSTGGAPLETAIGDAMVARGVRLVSRLGSSECGFLLSSHRDYENEKDWELLRNDSPYADALRFEETADPGPNGSKRYEMVVTSQWSSLTKSNREDGSYASGDLYEPHPYKPQVWRYVGRGDDVIVMSNGEKASPGAIESILRSSSDVEDVLVVGSDRSELGVLLFPRRPTTTIEDLRSSLSPLIDQANKSSPSFASISTDMCIVIKPERGVLLPKSSKGTVQRGVANEVYKEEIDRLYNGTSAEDEVPRRDLADIRQCILGYVKTVVGQERAGSLELTTDLFSWGVNSVTGSRIRAMMQKSLYLSGSTLPSNIVFERPTIQQLAEYVYNQQEGVKENRNQSEESLRLMQDLAARYGSFDAAEKRIFTEGEGEGDILLTGGTGSLGAHLIHRLCCGSPNSNTRIICLVRATDDAMGRSRILDTLSAKGLEVDERRLVVLSADVSRDRLGLTPAVYDNLVESVRLVIHAAWPVHFASNLISFEDQIRGARNLINFVRQTPRRNSQFYFCSSIASVLGGSVRPAAIVDETPSTDPATASPIGYSQSKWVVEKICRLADELPDMRGRVHILRIGQLCGDTVTGYWNEKEGWPLLIRTSQTTGCLPDLKESPSWLPVDLAAQTIVDITRASNSDLIYHVVHPTPTSWKTVIAGLAAADVGFETVTPAQWVRKVEESISENEDDPSGGMLPLWRSAYGIDARQLSDPTVDASHAIEASPTLYGIAPICAENVGTMVRAWQKSGFLHK